MSRLHLSTLFRMRARGTVTNTEQPNVPPLPPTHSASGLEGRKGLVLHLKIGRLLLVT